MKKKTSSTKKVPEVTNIVTCGDEIIRPATCIGRHPFRRLKGKGALVAQLTKALYGEMNKTGIPTHLISGARGMRANQFLAHTLNLIPIRVVVRHFPFGSYIARYQTYTPQQVLENYVVEMFCDDPSSSKYGYLMVVDTVGRRVLYFNPKKPLHLGFSAEQSFPKDDIRWLLIMKVVNHGRDIALSAFSTMRQLFMQTCFTLVDASFIFGFNASCDLMLAGTVDNQSWRVWKKYDPKKPIDISSLRANPSMVDLWLPGRTFQNYHCLAEVMRA